jgi:putative salt-induced outer membrane protein YdiY
MRLKIIVGVLAICCALEGVAAAATIELVTGDKLEDVVIVEENELRVVVEHPTFGRLVIPARDIKVPEPEAEAAVKPGLFGTWVLRGWTKALSAGFSGSSGVTKENNVNADLQLNNETESHRDAFVARYFYADANSNKTNNEFLARHIHDFLIKNSRLFAYLGGGYKYDEFQIWDHRFTGSGGIGYDIVKNDTFKLTGRAGPGFTVTRGDGEIDASGKKLEADREDFNGVAMAMGSWHIAEGLDWTAEMAYLPVLNDLPDFRAVALSEIKVAIGVVEGLSFKVGGSYEYDSQNVSERNDRKYYGNIVYEF